MDYRTLRDELQAGSRLPSPTYSTPKMSHLIQTCWLADPIERPTFTKIKNQLHQSSDISAYDVDRKNNDYLTVLSDDSMYKQYKLIQESNPMFNTVYLYSKQFTFIVYVWQHFHEASIIRSWSFRELNSKSELLLHAKFWIQSYKRLYLIAAHTHKPCMAMHL